MMRGVNGLVGLVCKLLEKKSSGGGLGSINNLPVEILEKIFLLLPHRDLKVGPGEKKLFKIFLMRWQYWSVKGGRRLGRRKDFGLGFLSGSTQETWL